MSLRDELTRKGLPTEPFEIEGIDTPMAVRALSPAQMLKASKVASSEDAEESLMGQVAVWVLVDPATGERHFADDDAEWLMDHVTLDVLKRIGEKAQALAGVAADEGKGD